MEAFKQFFIQYWKYILIGFLYLVLLVCSLIRKKVNCNLLDKFYSEVVNLLPGFICRVETPGNGESKKQAVILLACNQLEKLLGRKLSSDEFNFYSDKFSKLIEKILLTPTKKGEFIDD